jgi:hypothetical protein
MFEAADANKDGKITPKEFQAWLRKDPSLFDLILFYGRLLASIDPLSVLKGP